MCRRLGMSCRVNNLRRSCMHYGSFFLFFIKRNLFIYIYEKKKQIRGIVSQWKST